MLLRYNKNIRSYFNPFIFTLFLRIFMFMENEIINKYVNDNRSIEQLCTEFKVGKIKIKKILLDNNVLLKKRGAQPKNKKYVDFSMNLEDKLIKCKKCGVEYHDVKNKSGIAISHIKECYPDICVPTKFLRTEYKKEKGIYWHFQYFDVIDKPDFELEYLHCPECDWKTTDLANKSGCFSKHVENKHSSVYNFLILYPNYTKYFNAHFKKENRKKILKDDFVTCKICNEKLKYVNQKHLDKHNTTLREYKIKYLNSSFLSQSTIEKLKISYDNNLKYYENNFKSKPEIEIRELIENLGIKVISNNKEILNGVEIDIFLNDLNIAIEYNGLFYHNDKMGKNKWFHLNKQNIAKKKGINLIHIFEDEWINKKDIVIKKIIHLVGKNNSPKIYGRNTTIKSINKTESELFCEMNHIQGSSPQSTYNIGAFYENKLIGVMSFLKQKNDTYILNRFATDINYRCIGVGSKLFSFFVKGNKNSTIISFADRRWTVDGTNNFYTNLGFKLDGIVNPDYRYFNPKINRNQRIHKFNFRKKILLKNYGDILNKDMTENEMTLLIGCSKIWDCGLFRYKYN